MTRARRKQLVYEDCSSDKGKVQATGLRNLLVHEDCSSDKGKADFSAGLRTLLVYELVYEQGDKGRAQATGLRTLLVYEDCSNDKSTADFSAGLRTLLVYELCWSTRDARVTRARRKQLVYGDCPSNKGKAQATGLQDC